MSDAYEREQYVPFLHLAPSQEVLGIKHFWIVDMITDTLYQAEQCAPQLPLLKGDSPPISNDRYSW